MPALTVRAIGYAAGAEVRGVDLREPLDDATFEALQRAWNEHLVLCFPGQSISKRDLLDFAARFEGTLEDFSDHKTSDAADSRIFILTTKPANGAAWDGYKQGLHWHTDLSYTESPANATFTLAKEIPSVGGDTMFANGYLAYESLSQGMRALAESLKAIHDQSNPSLSAQPAEIVAAYKPAGARPPVVHDLVRIHPATGRKTLYFAERVRRFAGMTEEESAPFCAFFREHTTRPEFIYRHRWRVNDLVMWDNRCLMHYAPLDYDPDKEARLMWRCSLIGPRVGIKLATLEPEVRV